MLLQVPYCAGIFRTYDPELRVILLEGGDLRGTRRVSNGGLRN